MSISFDIDLSNDLIYFLPSKNVQRFFFSFFSTFKIHRNIVALNVLSELKIRRTRPSKQINFHGLVDNPFSFSPSSCKAIHTRRTNFEGHRHPPVNDEGEEQKSRSVNEDAFQSVCASRWGVENARFESRGYAATE